MHVISSYRSNRPTDTPTQTQTTHRQDRLQYTAPQLARSVMTVVVSPSVCLSVCLVPDAKLRTEGLYQAENWQEGSPWPIEPWSHLQIEKSAGRLMPWQKISHSSEWKAYELQTWYADGVHHRRAWWPQWWKVNLVKLTRLPIARHTPNSSPLCQCGAV